MKIIDTHVHYWNPPTLQYNWLDGLPTLNQPVLPTAIPHGGDGWEVEQIVFVQADCLPEQGLAEAQWVAELAQTDPRIKGIVAFAPLELGPSRVAPYLDALKQIPLVKGVRRLIQDEPLGFCTQPAFVEAVASLEVYNFSFDICIRHFQLVDAIALVEQCQEINFVLDHLGKPAIAAGELDPWREQIEAMAALPNAMCKLSGMVTEAAPDWTTASLIDYASHILTAFTPARVMFGSDSPVFWLANTTYAGWVDEALKLTSMARLNPAEMEALFFRNAQFFYRL